MTGEKVYPETLEESITKYQGLVKYHARRYAQPTIPTLVYEDLVQEGLMKLMEIYQKGFRGKEFEKMFKVSIPNLMMDLAQKAYAPCRNGVVVELDDELVGNGDQKINDLFFEHSLQNFFELLSEDQKTLLAELLDPSDDSVLEAKKEMLRKRKLKAQGNSVRGYATYEVKKKHIAKALGMDKDELKYILSNLQKIARKNFLAS